MDQQAESPWYQDGLRFKCTRCGNCCRGPGYVWVDETETAILAHHFQMDEITFEKLYTRQVGRSRCLRDQANDSCIFFDEACGCLVYEARPRQCQTWPFWEHNLRSQTDWKATQERCPGSGQGELFTAEDISARLAMMKKRP